MGTFTHVSMSEGSAFTLARLLPASQLLSNSRSCFILAFRSVAWTPVECYLPHLAKKFWYNNSSAMLVSFAGPLRMCTVQRRPPLWYEAVLYPPSCVCCQAPR